MARDLLSHTLHEQFGHDDFRPGQRELVEAIMSGRDVLGVLPTGAGKSICYQLPAAMEPGETTIVVSPLISLMNGQAAAMQAIGVPALALNSGIFHSKRGALTAKVRAGDYRLLYVSPERLQDKDFSGEIEGIDCPRVVVDEAHCASMWGHEFRPEYAQIADFAARMSISQIVALTATASAMVTRDIKSLLGLKTPVEYRSDIYRPNLEYEVTKFENENEKMETLLSLIREAAAEEGTTIVYCSTVVDVNKLWKFLSGNGIGIESYHGKAPDPARRDIEAKFQDGKIKVLVATNAFGMGIDMPTVRRVIHYNIPGTVEGYLHESGRAGRDGKPAKCHLLYSPQDLEVQEFFARDKNPDPRFVKNVYKALEGQLAGSRDQAMKKRRTFKLNPVALRILFTTTDPRNGKRISRDTKVNAALDLLKKAGIIREFSDYLELKSFDESVLAPTLNLRQRIAQATLGQMMTYAESPVPSQQLLIRLMEEDLEA